MPIVEDQRLPSFSLMADFGKATRARVVAHLPTGPGPSPNMPIVEKDGSPTFYFLAVARKAFALSPAENISLQQPIANADGTPTPYMLRAWDRWTS